MSQPAGELGFDTVLGVLNQTKPGETLDLAQITRADSAGLALMLELTRRARASGGDLKITHASEQIRGLAAFFGVDSVLNFQ